MPQPRPTRKRKIKRRINHNEVPRRPAKFSLLYRNGKAMLLRMSVMLSKTYDALKAAGAPEEQARAAAEEIAAYENRVTSVESDLRLLKWMVGANFAVSIAILLRVFLP